MAEAEVSVILAACNARRFVVDAARSILDQTLRELKLIAVDDGSTDGTGRLLRGIKDTRLKVITAPHRGAYHARNLALRELDTPYVAIMDADDWSHRERLEKQLRHLETHPELVAVGCALWLVSPRGRLVYEDRPPVGAREVTRLLHSRGAGIYPQTCTMRTEVVKKVGGYRTAFPQSGDLDLLLRISEFGPLDNLPETLYFYRLHGASLTFANKARRDYYARVALELRSERQATGTDAVDRGERITPFEETGRQKGDARRDALSSALGYFYRLSAEQKASRGQPLAALGRVALSLAHAPFEPNTWRALGRIVLGRQVGKT